MKQNVVMEDLAVQTKNKYFQKFLEKAKKIHNNKFDYTKVKYVDSRTKIEIVCPIHGSFWQAPANHLQGQGCINCYNDRRGNTIKSTTDQFIQKANNVHNGKYNYTKVEYIHTDKKVCIGCPDHGEFWQTPHDHLSKHGCPLCAKEKETNRKRKGLNSFIKESNVIHNNKYDYSLVKEVNNRNDEVEIICPIHGIFRQRAKVHLNGHGCPTCGGYIPRTKESFCKDAIQIHNNKYNYSKVDYRGIDIKVCIICPKHGEFWQTPHTHLHGSGCPQCKTSKGEKKIFSILEKHSINYIPQYKIFIDDKKYFIDFCIEFKDKLYFIEYNGVQHYIPVEIFGGIEQLQKQQTRDLLIRDFCINNSIELLEISYKTPLEDLENLLLEKFKIWEIPFSQDEMMENSK